MRVQGYAGVAALGVGLAALAGLGVAREPEALAGACNPTWLWLDVGPSLARNGLVLVETTADRREAVNAALGQATFVGPGAPVAALVRQRLEGSVLQVLLTPASPLPAGVDVQLSLGRADLDALVSRFTLRASDVIESEPPLWSGPPRLGARTRDSEKGEVRDVYRVRVPVARASHVLARAESKDGVVTSLIYPIRQGEIRVGRSTCMGVGERLEGQGPWLVRLTALGAGGSEIPAPGAALVLRFP